jgi:hypothetical protein
MPWRPVLSVGQKLELCRPPYAAAHLPLFVRMTPFSEPATLDVRLQALGMKARDDTRVMVRPSLDDFTAPVLPPGYRLERLTHRAFAELVGGFRGFVLAHRQAHAERLQESPVALSRLCAARPRMPARLSAGRLHRKQN